MLATVFGFIGVAAWETARVVNWSCFYSFSSGSSWVSVIDIGHLPTYEQRTLSPDFSLITPTSFYCQL